MNMPSGNAGARPWSEYEREGGHSKPQEPETPYIENCTQAGRESIGRHGRVVPSTSEQSQSTHTTQPESTGTTPTASTPEATTETSPRSASSPPQAATECTAYLTPTRQARGQRRKVPHHRFMQASEPGSSEVQARRPCMRSRRTGLAMHRRYTRI